MKKTRTIIHTESSSGWGGQEIRVLAEMLAMRQRGHRVFLCATSNSKIFAKARNADFEVLPFSDRRRDYVSSILKLARFFRAKRAEVVNPHSSRDGWIAGIAARMAGVPLIIRSRHIEVDYPHVWLSRISYHRIPHHVFTTSERISQRLVAELRLKRNRVDTIPTGLDLDKYDPGLKSTLRDEMKIGKDQPLIGMISVLRSWKGHAYFLEAAKILSTHQPAPHFWICGEGTRRRFIERKIAEYSLQSQVTLLGHREDIPQVLAALDVLLLPSTAHEGIPQIVLQAQAMGKAVVGTTVGGIPEVIEDGKTGLLCPPADSAALAAATQKLIDSPALRRELGEAASARAHRDYGIDKMCEKIESIYDRYLSR